MFIKKSWFFSNLCRVLSSMCCLSASRVCLWSVSWMYFPNLKPFLLHLTYLSSITNLFGDMFSCSTATHPLPNIVLSINCKNRYLCLTVYVLADSSIVLNVEDCCKSRRTGSSVFRCLLRQIKYSHTSFRFLKYE